MSPTLFTRRTGRNLYTPDSDFPPPPPDETLTMLKAAVGFIVAHAKLLAVLAGFILGAGGFLITFSGLPRQTHENTVAIQSLDKRVTSREASDQRKDIFLCTLLEQTPKTHRPECVRILSLDGRGP